MLSSASRQHIPNPLNHRLLMVATYNITIDTVDRNTVVVFLQRYQFCRSSEGRYRRSEDGGR